MFRNPVFSRSLLLVLLSIGLFTNANAERAKEYGNYIVHYNAVTTDFLTPTTAKQYNLTRSKNRGMVTIAVQEKAPEGKAMGKPLAGNITGYATNLNGQTRNLKFRKIKEGSAIYYIDDFSVTNQEVINFVLSVKPEGQDSSYSLKFKQQFFTR